MCMTEKHGEGYESHAEVATAAELQLLKEHEPLIEFRILGAGDVSLSTGRQSRVSVLEYEKGGEQYRVLWKRMAADKGLSNAEASLLDSRLEPYRSSLQASGWIVPQLFHHRVSQLDEETQIFSYEQYIPGGDGEKMLQDPSQPNFRKWFLIESVVKTLYNYSPSDLQRTELAGQTVTKLPHGLDLKLANLVLSESDDKLYFVDLFGPKEITQQGEWRTFTPKLDSLDPDALMSVCASREGSLLRCWRLAESHWNNGYTDVGELRADFIKHIKGLAIPGIELEFITDEINSDFPWLKQIYKEHKV